MLYANLGWFYQIEKKDYDLAVRYYQKAIDFYPNQYTFAYDNLIRLFLQLSRENEVISVAEKLTQISPQSAVAFYYLGLSYSHSSRFEEAETAFKTAIQLEPNNLVWITKLAKMLVKKGDFARATQEYEKALSLDPLYDEALCGITYIFTFEKPDYKKAISYANKAIKENPNSIWLPICFYNLGYAYMGLGDKIEAKSAFENYLERVKSLPEDNSYQEYIKDVKNKLQELSQ